MSWLAIFFDVQTDNGTTSDEEGAELDGPEAAPGEGDACLADGSDRIILARRTYGSVEVRDAQKPLFNAVLSLSIERQQ